MELDNSRLKKLTIWAILWVAMSNVFGFQWNVAASSLSDSQKTIVKNSLDSIIGKFDKVDTKTLNKSLHLLLLKINNQLKWYKELDNKDLNTQRRILVLEYLKELIENRISSKPVSTNSSDKPPQNSTRIDIPVSNTWEYPTTNTRAS